MSGVLVTGGLGVIGSWVTRKCAEQGIRVVTYSRRPDISLIRDIVGEVDCVAGDILDLPSIIHTIKSYDIDKIIHMSAVMPEALEQNPFQSYRINVDGTINILEAARLMNIKRVVFTSTKGVYEKVRNEYAHPTYKPIDEDYPKAPNNTYSATKFFGENMALSYQRIYGLDVIIMRFAGIYGPGKQARHGALGLHSRIIESAMLEKPLRIPQGRDQMNDMIYVRDVANGVVLACFTKNANHCVFHLGTGRGETFGQLVEIVNKIFGKVPIEIGPGLDPLQIPMANYCIMNIDRARRELGYNPQYDLEKGVRDYIEMMRQLEIQPAVLS